MRLVNVIGMAASFLVGVFAANAQQGTVSTAGVGTAGVHLQSGSTYPDVDARTGDSTSSGFRVFNSSDALLLNVSASGKVGVGTATPAQRLHVFENADVNTIVEVENRNTGASTAAIFRAYSDTGAVNVQAHGSGRTVSRFGVASLGGWSEVMNWQGNGLIVGTLQSAPLILGTNNTSRLHIAADGKIGINTSTPTGTLHVYGSATQDAFMGFGPDTTNGPALNIGYAGLSFGRSAGFINARPDALATAPNPSLRFLTANVQRMIITNTGSIGIGTVAPEAFVHVNGNSSQSMLVQRGSKGMFVNANYGGGNSFSQIANRAADNMGLSLSSKDTSPEYLYVSTAGYVGIGTTTPGRSLDIVGTYAGIGVRAIDPSAVNTGFGAGVEFTGSTTPPARTRPSE